MSIIDLSEQATGTRLWGIAGIFETYLGPNYKFGGWFTQGGILGGDIYGGRLVDEFGSSEIHRGTFHPEQELSFLKHYPRRNDSFQYKLTFKNGIWIGEYRGLKGNKIEILAKKDIELEKDSRTGRVEAVVSPVSSTSHCLTPR